MTTGLVAILLVSLCCVQAGITDCGADCTGGNCTNTSPDNTLRNYLPNMTCTGSGELCEDIRQLSTREDVGCCSLLLACGANDVDSFAAGVHDVSYTWVAVYHSVIKLVIKWSQPLNDRGVKLFINTTDTTTLRSQYDRCHCLPPHTREYTVDVELSVGKRLDIKVIGLPYIDNIAGDDSTMDQRKILIPSGCWDESVNESSIAKCGPRLPTSPRGFDGNNVTLYGSVARLCISWRPPLDSISPIIAYMITISDTVHYTIAETQQYCTDVPTGPTYHIKVRASSGEVFSVNRECTPNCSSNATICCWGPATSTDVSTPAASSSSSQKAIVLVAVLCSVGVLAAIAVLVAVTLLCVHYRKSHHTVRYIPLVSRQVFIISSPQSGEDDRLLVRKLCHSLADHSVKPVTYDYDVTDRQQGPGHSGVYQWSEDHFINSDVILFVCNKKLCDTWSSGDTNDSSFVSACKMLLQGYLSSSQDRSRFGVVLLRESDRCYIPSLYLRNFKTFTVFQNGDQCNIEDLLETILYTN